MLVREDAGIEVIKWSVCLLKEKRERKIHWAPFGLGWGDLGTMLTGTPPSLRLF